MTYSSYQTGISFMAYLLLPVCFTGFAQYRDGFAASTATGAVKYEPIMLRIFIDASYEWLKLYIKVRRSLQRYRLYYGADIVDLSLNSGDTRQRISRRSYAFGAFRCSTLS